MTLTRWFILGLAIAGCKSGPQLAPAVAQAPAFTAPLLGGGEQVFDPSSLQHPTLLVFWASWCTTCKADLPAVLEIDRAQKGHLDVLGVSVDEQLDRAELFANEAHLPYPSVTDPKLVVSDLFNVKATPSFVLVARGGEVRHRATAIDEALLAAIALEVQ